MEKPAMMVRARTARAMFCGRTWTAYAAKGWPKSDSMQPEMSMTV